MTTQRPDFHDLLAHPLVKQALPSDFNIEREARHLETLWSRLPALQKYKYQSFVHAGGSGMVFKVLPEAGREPRALKIVRSALYNADPRKDPHLATSLSPVSASELKALEELSHPSLVRLYEFIGDGKKGVVAVTTTFVEKPEGLDQYLRNTLEVDPERAVKKGIDPFSPARLDKACEFLIARFTEVVSALEYMHEQGIYHFDIKPVNILASKRQAVLTDMGASVHLSDLERLEPDATLRVHFTWTYAHPLLKNVQLAQPTNITGGGLKVSGSVDPKAPLQKYDLFALGRTMQECLAILESEFGERSHASYAFRFLHVIAGLLLDGHNAPAPARRRFTDMDGRRFVHDVALDYPPELFANHKIQTTAELSERLQRYDKHFSWNRLAVELDDWQPETINTVVNSPAPFTERVKAVMGHPCVKRLRDELQLGWMREVYPEATHNRWAHSMGVFSAVVQYTKALLSDPEVPTFRILVDQPDLDNLFVAALLHDVGQSAFGHDFEEAAPELFSHENLVRQLAKEQLWGEDTLEKTLMTWWPDVSLDRIVRIIRNVEPLIDEEAEALSAMASRSAIDGLGQDIIKGPIDADKLDYLIRDSINCGVTYGQGVDLERFLRSLTVTARPQAGMGPRLALGYKAKGRPAVASLLLARYQMFGAIYWHHTFRCIKAMLLHVLASSFKGITPTTERTIHNSVLTGSELSQLFYQRVVLRRSWMDAWALLGKGGYLGSEPPSEVSEEPALDYTWRLADNENRELVYMLAQRKLYKRIFELRIGEVGDLVDYATLAADLAAEKRVINAKKIQRYLLDSISKAIAGKGPVETRRENVARERYQHLANIQRPLVVIDFPTRGVPSVSNSPVEMGDALRKYFTLMPGTRAPADNVFATVRKLQEQIATFRVFCAPELHELVIRYLDTSDVQACVEQALPKIKR